MNSVKWHRKLGLGAVDAGASENDISIQEFVDNELGRSAEYLGYASHRSNPAELVSWPDDLSYSLTERIERSVRQRTEMDALDAEQLESDQERSLRIQEINKRYSVVHTDIYRFFHTAQHTMGDINFRLSIFWLNHFTVGDVGPNVETIGDYWSSTMYDGLQGSFRDLLFKAISHPTMLTYLDNIYSVGENSEKGRNCRNNCTAGLNDNLARELLELHTVTPNYGYSEADIRVVANILSGWGFIFDKQPPIDEPDYLRAFVEYHAEPGIKTVFGQSFSEGPEGLRELTDFLASQDATIKFLSKKLLQHFAGEQPLEADISAVERVWKLTDGDLRSVHREVLIKSYNYPGQRLLWPSQWAISVLRMSNAQLFKGFREIDIDFMEAVERDPRRLQNELGDSFWSGRQPNGYSYRTADWVSSEHMDRRIRFASLVFAGGNPKLKTDDIIELHQFSEQTKQLVNQATTERDKFILLTCSPEFLEV